jgi:hypothetical protein
MVTPLRILRVLCGFIFSITSRLETYFWFYSNRVAVKKPTEVSYCA